MSRSSSSESRATSQARFGVLNHEPDQVIGGVLGLGLRELTLACGPRVFRQQVAQRRGPGAVPILRQSLSTDRLNDCLNLFASQAHMENHVRCPRGLVVRGSADRDHPQEPWLDDFREPPDSPGSPARLDERRTQMTLRLCSSRGHA